MRKKGYCRECNKEISGRGIEDFSKNIRLHILTEHLELYEMMRRARETIKDFLIKYKKEAPEFISFSTYVQIRPEKLVNNNIEGGKDE